MLYLRPSSVWGPALHVQELHSLPQRTFSLTYHFTLKSSSGRLPKIAFPGIRHLQYKVRKTVIYLVHQLFVMTM
jgi:hypothetical protein